MILKCYYLLWQSLDIPWSCCSTCLPLLGNWDNKFQTMVRSVSGKRETLLRRIKYIKSTNDDINAKEIAMHKQTRIFINASCISRGRVVQIICLQRFWALKRTLWVPLFSAFNSSFNRIIIPMGWHKRKITC